MRATFDPPPAGWLHELVQPRVGCEQRQHHRLLALRPAALLRRLLLLLLLLLLRVVVVLVVPLLWLLPWLLVLLCLPLLLLIMLGAAAAAGHLLWYAVRQQLLHMPLQPVSVRSKLRRPAAGLQLHALLLLQVLQLARQVQPLHIAQQVHAGLQRSRTCARAHGSKTHMHCGASPGLCVLECRAAAPPLAALRLEMIRQAVK
jgi:hypothetical protein